MFDHFVGFALKWLTVFTEKPHLERIRELRIVRFSKTFVYALNG